MLRSLNKIKRFEVLLSDNLELGVVSDFFFDEKGWTVKYLVADTGARFAGRSILVSADAFCAPEWGREKFIVSLSREQVETSPGIDIGMPLKLAELDRLHRHYGWTATHFGKTSYAKGEKEHLLQEAMKVIGYHVQGGDGVAGTVDDLILDDEGWKVRYIVVDVGRRLMGRKVLVSTDWVDRINYEEGNINLAMTAETIRHGPEYDPDERISREFETRLYDYFNMPGYWLRKEREAA